MALGAKRRRGSGTEGGGYIQVYSEATLKDITKAMKMEPNPITRAANSVEGCLTKLRTGNVQVDDADGDIVKMR